MRVLSCVFLAAAFAAAVSASPIDDEITKLEATIAELKVVKAAETNNNEALKFVKAVAMASSSGSSTAEAGDTSANSAFDIEPQPTRATTEAPSTSSSSSSAAASSTTSSGSVEAATSASAEASASASASSSASTVAPTAFAVVSAIVYAML
ncbi:hypothetical protein PF005_g26196 [Phytophthora fragariae]|uniref:RxLR effector protein n=1 Tax=Phytophthora fragariae TaxID=53985 RepID=A0A6A3HV37_9STRA|nr:hypothetical protein PF003_g37838 [Phytophthora fragariae]KAE8922731.1 hypothetical protein PF009_g27010 [Phytophthora fragariae]KAE8973870.1 hypothetical protein PF011_g25084 [Phytophthora fragariae]KAE9071923.1 hypothetical protein PF010_g25683 [Phytophthora fragariae]KAE9073602.1 hypothetical protein PF007_g25747 [Phytophthora fragariae]